MITALAGGVGAAKLLLGISKIVDPKELTIIVNTGDDIELHGLHISPDIDIVTYTLAGIADSEKGWGIQGDTFHCLEALKRLGGPAWFNLGDQDLATHIFRTNLLRQGQKLSEVTAEECRLLGVNSKILPMTDDAFETRIKTEQGMMHFEEFFVKYRGQLEVLTVELAGAASAQPADGVVEAILEADCVVVCPSNPIVSIGTILSIVGIRDALRQTAARKVAVTPLINGAPVKGPADKLLKGLGYEVSSVTVAQMYSDFLDEFILDKVDAAQKSRIERFGLKVKVTNTLMLTLDDKVSLAKAVIDTL